jgi:hypothetical protein
MAASAPAGFRCTGGGRSSPTRSDGRWRADNREALVTARSETEGSPLAALLEVVGNRCD